ncbi:MAG: threonine/serine exporter family protein [Bacteriovoracaceae bacterium]|nr:threonine/serine exporter family protein [Bacteriovoracaceae bacterium]
MLKEEYLQRIKFIVQYGRSLHSVGAPAHSLEAALNGLCERLGLKGSFVSIPTAIFYSFRFLDEEVTRIARVEPSGVNLGRLTKVDLVAQDVIRHKLSVDEGHARLEEIFNSADPYSHLITVCCFSITSAGMLTLFGGTWGDLLTAALVGALIGILSLPKHFGVVAQLYEALMAFAATLLASLFGKVSPDINLSVVILSSLIMFIPGLNITISIAEIATQNLTSGTSRLMGGFMILLKLAFGVFVGSKLASHIHINGLSYTFATIPYWVTFISVPITALMSTVIFKAEAREAKWITLAGVFGYALSKIGSNYFGPEMGLFIGGLGVGAAANLFARTRFRPSSIFQFPGLILLVPGSIAYRGLNYLFARDVILGFDTAFTMITLAFSLVVGVFVGNIVIKPRVNY